MSLLIFIDARDLQHAAKLKWHVPTSTGVDQSNAGITIGADQADGTAWISSDRHGGTSRERMSDRVLRN